MTGRRAHTSADKLTGVALLFLTLAGWSSSPLFLKYFVSSIDVWTSNGWRYAISALIWLPAVIVALRNRETPSALWRAALWPSVFNVAGQICFAWVLYLNIDPGLMAFLLRLHIVFATTGAFLLFPDERRLMGEPAYWVGMLIVVAGVVGTIFLRHEPLGRAGEWGIAAGLVAGALFGCYAVAVRRCMSSFSSVTSFAVISLYSAIGLLVPMLLLARGGGVEALRLLPFEMVMLFVSALAGIALGHVFYYASMARLGVAVASGVLLLQPFVTACASALIYGERLTAAQWVSGAVSVLGAALLLRIQAPRLSNRDPDALHCGRLAEPVRERHADVR